MSRVKWSSESWNPVTGCSKYSTGCDNCYAERMALRLKAMGVKGYERGFSVNLRYDRLNKPLLKSVPSFYFVVSMGDLFHEDVPFEYIDKVMDVIEKTPRHYYHLLTKRAERMADYFALRKTADNLWLGVTVENKKALRRIDFLRNINASIHFICAEPLLEDLGKFSLDNIQWVIVGGESGVGARAMKEGWVLGIKSLCEEGKVSFSFKQWGAWGMDGKMRSRKANGRLLQGKLYLEMPGFSRQYSFF